MNRERAARLAANHKILKAFGEGRKVRTRAMTGGSWRPICKDEGFDLPSDCYSIAPRVSSSDADFDLVELTPEVFERIKDLL